VASIGALGLHIRQAQIQDAPPIARLHAESWRRHYRGAYADGYLDGDVVADRLDAWTQRLASDVPSRVTLGAWSDGDLIGFVHVELDGEAPWGALVDNLHVDRSAQRRGAGSRLMAAAAGAVLARRPGAGLYLWVLAQNRDAQAFYAARGGRLADTRPVPPPGGVDARLCGQPLVIRVVWPDPATLLPA